MLSFDLSWALHEVWRLLLFGTAAAEVALLFAGLIRIDRALARPGALLLREGGLWPYLPSIGIGTAPIAAWLAWSPYELDEWLTAMVLWFSSGGLTALGAWSLARMLVLLPDGVVPGAPWRRALRWDQVAFVKDGYYLLAAHGRPLPIDRTASWVGRFAAAALKNLPDRVFAGEEPSVRDLLEDSARRSA